MPRESSVGKGFGLGCGGVLGAVCGAFLLMILACGGIVWLFNAGSEAVDEAARERAAAEKKAAAAVKTGDEVEDKKSPPAARPKADAKLQADRLAFIGKLQKQRIVEKIDTPGTDPRLYVLPAFAGLTFDQKTLFANVCYAWAFELPAGKPPADFDRIMWIYDGLTNKKLGSISAKSGLALD